MGEEFPASLAGFGPGAVVAGYRLEAQVGAGGMAVVYRATRTDPDSDNVMSAAFGPGGTILATGNADGSTDLWRIGSSTT